ncbi:MAG: flagellar type III secretion system pore protein FliP [Gammaproteobacteria bacterium]|nr:flagellar type III secretion system pore protein FliP [Gammaproteobacteria bacterium]MDH3537749.1 flagellar type III secretion system pore protein FliP [Gammaproteobacteria bacterium]
MKAIPGLLFMLVIPEVHAQSIGIPAISVDGGSGDGQTYTVTLEILALMTMLTLLPAILLMMTSFTRIIIVLSILRQALGTAQTPSNQIILGLALFLTLFVMSPVFDQVYQLAIQPYLEGSMSALDALRNATEPFKTFMLAQTRETDIRMFADIAGVTEIESPEKTPLTLLMPAFVTSELKTAFQIGFLIFIPFVVIDLVVASVLMSMGMMMLSPMIISLPFKLMLFVLVDGWSLIMGTLASSFLLGA